MASVIPFGVSAILGGLGGLFGHHRESQQRDAQYQDYLRKFNQHVTNEHSRRAIIGGLASALGAGRLLPGSGAGSISDFENNFKPQAGTEDQVMGNIGSGLEAGLGGAMSGLGSYMSKPGPTPLAKAPGAGFDVPGNDTGDIGGVGGVGPMAADSGSGGGGGDAKSGSPSPSPSSTPPTDALGLGGSMDITKLLSLPEARTVGQ